MIQQLPSLDRSAFLQAVFEKLSKEQAFEDPLTALLSDEWVELCTAFDLTAIQDSWSWRNVHVGRELAKLLIDNKGFLDKDVLEKALYLLREKLFSLGPGRHHDASRQIHLLNMLQLLEKDREISYALKRIARPEGHLGAERLIRETLLLPEATPLTNIHAKQAALSCVLTSLRQNVGSCFATAPAILIQQNQAVFLLDDIGQLFATGRLSRVYGGVEHTVPLALGWGVGDLLRPFFLSTLGENPLQTLAFSPGLQEAFRAAGLIDGRASKDEKVTVCHHLLAENMFENRDPFQPITTDEILRVVLLHAFGVTEEDVKRFRERQAERMLGGLMPSPFSGQVGKQTGCARYLKAYDLAKGAFKALTDNALLKAWEFTLASLAETKADFAKWNFYVSLGVNPEEPEGIGRSLYEKMQEQLTRINQDLEEYQSRYDHLFAQTKSLEIRFRRVETERDAEWLRAEYHMRRHEIGRVLAERDEIFEKGQKLSNLMPFLISFYGEKIREYFQEVYDPEMHDVSANPYDDSPAGFRLLYKHGRTNTSLWTMIYTAEEYLQYLSSFFVSTEIELTHRSEVEGLQKEVSELTTAILTTIKRPEFLESSFFRLAYAYKEPLVEHPLQHLDQVKRKPWSYISGGTMGTLVSCYYGKGGGPKEARRWVESENELLAFYIDTMKELPHAVQRQYQLNKERPMLAFSPTHAFLSKPGWKLFREAWESSTYTYTWIRDSWIAPQREFLQSILLDNRMMDYILDKLLAVIPAGYRPLVKGVFNDFTFSMNPSEFREHILKGLSYEKWLQGGRRLDMIGEELDSILYRSLPLFPDYQLRERLEAIFNSIEEIDQELKKTLFEILEIAEPHVGKYKILSAVELRNSAAGVLMLALGSTRASIPFFSKILEAMRQNGFAYPEPILFADTNWVKNVFGFTVNPGKEAVELWRFDEQGSEGRPISQWKMYMDGTDRKEWGAYNAPGEYGLI